MQAIGYVRVSSAGQTADGVSLDAQKSKIRAWAEANDANLVEICADKGISGAKGDRPGLLKAIEYAEKHNAALIVYSLSRLSRSTRDTLAIAESLDKAGADLVSLSEKIDTTTAAGKMVFRMLAVLNEFERDQVSDRTKTALSYKKSNNEKTGGYCPYGYQVDDEGYLSKDKAESEVVDLILELREKNWSYSAIARHVNNKGYKTKLGKDWRAQQVKNIIKRAA